MGNRTRGVLAVVLIAVAACGGDDDGGSGPTNDTAGQVTATSAPTTVTPTTAAPSSTTVAPPVTTAPPTVATTTTTTVPTEPDADSLDLLLSSLWSVPSTSFRCNPGASLAVDYQAASDGGDFFVLCRTTDRIESVTAFAIRQPGGESLTFDVFRSEQFVERGESFTSGFPLYVATTDGSVRYVGVVFESGGQETLELHLWLPHDRPAGTWTADVAGTSATFDVDSPCATASSGTIDPFAFPIPVTYVDVIYTEWVDGSDVSEHCLALPDLVGESAASAGELLESVAGRRGVSAAITERAGCHVTGMVGDVVGQSPGPGSFANSTDDPSSLAVDLTVSVSECPVLDDWIGLTYLEAQEALAVFRDGLPWFRDFGFCGDDEVITSQVPAAGTRSPDVRLSC